MSDKLKAKQKQIPAFGRQASPPLAKNGRPFLRQGRPGSG